MFVKDLESQIQQVCRFCNPPEKQRIVYEGKYFYVMLSLGPIVEGYLLLVSKEHLSCCAEVPLIMSREFDYLYNKIIEIQSMIYGGSVAYEHGRAGSCMVLTEGSKHCYHAHMHFVPVAMDLNSAVSRDFDEIALRNLQEFRGYAGEKEGYLFVDDGSKHVYSIDGQIRRQYLRYKAATLIGREDLWDWVNNQGWNEIQLAKVKYNEPFGNLILVEQI